MRTLAPLLLGGLAFAGPAAAEPVDLETSAQELARDVVDGKYDAAVARFDGELAKRVDAAALRQLVEPLRAERAPARSVVVRLRRDLAEGLVAFTVKGNWTRGPVTDLLVTLRPDGRVAGLTLRDEPPPLDKLDAYETRTRLAPPFRGTWTARNAARDGTNPHWENRNQRFAVDWVIEEEGRSHRGDGRKNGDYLAYGQELLAPAAGTVVLLVDGIADNPVPGQRDAYYVPGNQIALDLGHGEFALFMHLQAGSMRVKLGDRVAPGQPLARVGNSGNSSEPHLHFQLADRPRLIDATALPAKFSDVLLDGKPTARAWPKEGSRLAARPAP